MTAAMSVVATCLPTGTADAQTCGTEYTIKDGETLAQIAGRVYGNPTQWTVIFYANQDRLGANMSLLVPGLSIRLPCIGSDKSGQAYVYRAVVSRGQITRSRLRAMLDQLFDGEAAPLVLQLMKTERFSSEELAELQKLIDQLESRSASAAPRPPGTGRPR